MEELFFINHFLHASAFFNVSIVPNDLEEIINIVFCGLILDKTFDRFVGSILDIKKTSKF